MFTNLDGCILVVKYSPDGTLIALGGSDRDFWTERGFVAVYDAHSLQKLGEQNHPFEISCLAWSSDGRYLAYGGKGGVLSIWEPSTDTLLCTYEGHSPELAFLPDACHPKRREVFAVAWHDETHLASAGDDRILRLWDARDATGTATSQRALSRVTEYTSDSLMAASHTYTVEEAFPCHSITVYDTPSGQATLSLLCRQVVYSLAWSPCSKKRCLAIGGWRSIHIWDITTGRQLATIDYVPHKPFSTYSVPPHSLAWSPDGGHLACCVERSWDYQDLPWPAIPGKHSILVVKDATNGVTRCALPTGDAISLDWSPCGNQIVVGCIGGFETFRVPSL